MKKFRHLKELYGAGGSFYSGKDLGTFGQGSLGTRGADSNYSRRMQATFPVDYFETEEEEEEEENMNDNILENRVYRNKKLKLLETLERNILSPGSSNQEKVVSLKEYMTELEHMYDETILESLGKCSLRNIIQEMKDPVEEEKTEEALDEDDVNEFSSAGAVAGYALPLGGTKQDLEDMKKVGFGIKK